MTDGPRDAGWYPDPWGASGEQRYYDGDAWQRNETVAADVRTVGRRGRRRVVSVVLLLVGAIGVVGVGLATGWFRSGSETAVARHSLAPRIRRRTSKPPEAVLRIRLRPYSRGDCVTWPQNHATLVDSKAVDCSMPHLMEMVGPVTLTGMTGAFPTPQAWLLIDASQCGPVVERYLGGPLDPYGRYYAGAIGPLEDGWLVGERVIWCGVAATGGDVAPDSPHPPMLGRVRAQEQQRVLASGICLGGPSAPDGGEVDCALPHLFEVTGTVDLGGRGLNTPTLDETRQAAESACRSTATGYLGRSVPATLESSSLDLAPASWAVGGRLVECVIGKPSGSGWVPVTGSQKAGT